MLPEDFVADLFKSLDPQNFELAHAILKADIRNADANSMYSLLNIVKDFEHGNSRQRQFYDIVYKTGEGKNFW